MSELVLVASCEGAQVRYVAVPTELINVPSEAAVALFSSSFSISKICIYLMRLDLLWVLFSAVLTWLICTEQQTEGFYSTMLRFTLKNFYHSLVVTVIFRLTYVIRVVVFVLQNNRRKAERRISVKSAIGYPTSRSFVTVFHDNVQFAAYPQIGSPEGLRVTPFRASFVS